MIRRALPTDLDGVLAVLKSVGNERKEPLQGFLMADYTKEEEKHRAKYGRDLRELSYAYVFLENQEVKAFLLAYTREEWLREVPGWVEEVHWSPGFDKRKTDTFVLINQTAMYPGLTGQGIGSRLYWALFADLARDGVRDVFAETVIAPIPNFASLNFRLKQKYTLAGFRFEEHSGNVYGTLVYHKEVTG